MPAQRLNNIIIIIILFLLVAAFLAFQTETIANSQLINCEKEVIELEKKLFDLKNIISLA